VRNRLRLPHTVKTGISICVICPPDSPAAQEARKAGATLVGEDEVFAQIKEGKIEFDKLLCHTSSLQKLNKAALGRILGPRGLMPSEKLGTVVKNVAAAVKAMTGGSEYRERLGVVRLAIGQLGFTPEQMQQNIKFLMNAMKKDIAEISDRTPKAIHEVVSNVVFPLNSGANVCTGPQFNKFARIQLKRRIQESKLRSHERFV
jgi:large subunit ribosomal protein L1